MEILNWTYYQALSPYDDSPERVERGIRPKVVEEQPEEIKPKEVVTKPEKSLDEIMSGLYPNREQAPYAPQKKKLTDSEKYEILFRKLVDDYNEADMKELASLQWYMEYKKRR